MNFITCVKTPRIILSNMEDVYHKPDQKTLQALKDMAGKLRIHSIESTNAAGSGYVAITQSFEVE